MSYSYCTTNEFNWWTSGTVLDHECHDEDVTLIETTGPRMRKVKDFGSEAELKIWCSLAGIEPCRCTFMSDVKMPELFSSQKSRTHS